MSFPLPKRVVEEAREATLKITKDYNEDLEVLKTTWAKYILPLLTTATGTFLGWSLFQSIAVSATIVFGGTLALVMLSLWWPGVDSPTFLIRHTYMAAYVASFHGRNPLPVALAESKEFWIELEERLACRRRPVLISFRHKDRVAQGTPESILLDALTIDALARLQARREVPVRQSPVLAIAGTRA